MKNIVINIHEENLATFNQKLADLNAKLSKKGLPLISCSMTSKVFEEQLSDAEISFMFNGEYHPWAEYRKYTLYTATLLSDFEQTNLKGIDCEFEGVVSLIEKSENDKIFTFKNINYSNFLTDCKCDECGKKISRNKYLVFSKAGKEVKTRDDLVVLGTSCAKEYFPFNIESYFGFLESAFKELGSYDEFSGSFGGCSSHYYTLSAIYIATLACTDNLKVYAKGGETKANVLGWLYNDKIDRDNYYRDVYQMPSNPIPFEDVISWVKDMFDKPTEELRGDFEVNARSVFFKTLDDGTREMRHEIHEKYMGIAVYAMFSAKQNHDKMVAKKLAEEKRIAENADVIYFGNVGDKFEKEMAFEKMFGFETVYGYQYILLFRDEENHVFKWSTNRGTYQCWHKTNGKDAFLEYEVGQRYLIKGTIKNHEEYRGVKQTAITRCKVLNDGCETHLFK